jgi:hypothetical protein
MPNYGDDPRYVFMDAQRERMARFRGDKAARRAVYASRFGRFNELDEEEQEEFMRDPYKARLVEESFFEPKLAGGGGGGSSAGSFFGGLIGGVAGFFMGGPAGAAVGMTLGSSVGSKVSDEVPSLPENFSFTQYASEHMPSVSEVGSLARDEVAQQVERAREDKELAVLNEPFDFAGRRSVSGAGSGGFSGLNPRLLVAMQENLRRLHLGRKEEKRSRIGVSGVGGRKWMDWPKERRPRLAVPAIFEI